MKNNIKLLENYVIIWYNVVKKRNKETLGGKHMRCNYFEYKTLTDNLFFGVALTNTHLNSATEQIRKYLVDGGAGEVVKRLHIGIRVETKETLLLGKEIVKVRFVWLNGERKGEELTINEICSIGMFLKHGAFYNKVLV